MDFFLFTVLRIIYFLLTICSTVFIVQAVMSWLIGFNVVNTHNDFVRAIWIALDRLTSPIYKPIRRIMPDLGALDLSPMVVILLIYILQKFIIGPMIGPV
jgi:YggT family protein